MDSENVTRKRPVSMMVKLNHNATEPLNVSQSSYGSRASTINSSVKMSIIQNMPPFVVESFVDQDPKIEISKPALRHSKIGLQPSKFEGVPKKRITFSVDSKPLSNLQRVSKQDFLVPPNSNNYLMPPSPDDSPSRSLKRSQTISELRQVKFTTIDNNQIQPKRSLQLSPKNKDKMPGSPKGKESEIERTFSRTKTFDSIRLRKMMSFSEASFSKSGMDPKIYEKYMQMTNMMQEFNISTTYIDKSKPLEEQQKQVIALLANNIRDSFMIHEVAKSKREYETRLEASKVDPYEAVKNKVYSSVNLETKHPALHKKIKDFLFRDNNLEKLSIKAQENREENEEDMILRKLENFAGSSYRTSTKSDSESKGNSVRSVVFKKFPDRKTNLYKGKYHKYFSGITTVLNDLKTRREFEDEYLLSKCKLMLTKVQEGEMSRILTDSDNSDFNNEEEKKYETKIEDIKVNNLKFRKDIFESMLSVEKNEMGGTTYIYKNPKNYHPELLEILNKKKKNPNQDLLESNIEGRKKGLFEIKGDQNGKQFTAAELAKETLYKIKSDEKKEQRRKLKETQMKKYHMKRMNSFEFEVKKEFNDPVNELFKDIKHWEPEYENKFSSMKTDIQERERRILNASCVNGLASHKFYRNNEVNDRRKEKLRIIQKDMSPFFYLNSNKQNLNLMRNDLNKIGEEQLNLIELEVANNIINSYKREKNHLFLLRKKYIVEKIEKKKQIVNDKKAETSRNIHIIEENKNFKKVAKIIRTILEKPETSLTLIDKEFSKTETFNSIKNNLSVLNKLFKPKLEREKCRNMHKRALSSGSLSAKNSRPISGIKINKDATKLEKLIKARKTYSGGPVFMKNLSMEIEHDKMQAAAIVIQKFCRMKIEREKLRIMVENKK